MNDYLTDTLDYLPKFSTNPNFNINCIGESRNRTLYDMVIDVDGSVVGNITFSNKDGVIFIRESRIRSSFNYLIEEAINNIKDVYHTDIVIQRDKGHHTKY